MIPPGPQRRAALVLRANPAPGRDYLVALEAQLSGGRTVSVTYVPDRALADGAAFAEYVAALEALPWETLEQLGAAMLDDLANEVVPRYMRVELAADGGGLRHRVRLEERQPHWRNETLVAGL